MDLVEKYRFGDVIRLWSFARGFDVRKDLIQRIELLEYLAILLEIPKEVFFGNSRNGLGLYSHQHVPQYSDQWAESSALELE